MTHLLSALFGSATTDLLKTKLNQYTIDTTTVDGVTQLLKQHFSSLDAFTHNVVQYATHPVQYFATHDALESALYTALSIGLACWLLTLPTGKYSWVDKLWSIVPVVFTVHWAATLPYSKADLLQYLAHVVQYQPRVVLTVVLPLLWGIRLTYNFYRKGGYAFDAEDYRWVYVQKLPIIGHPIVWQPFNLAFIGVYQIVLLMLITTPAYIVHRVAAQNINTVQLLTVFDYAIVALWLALFAVEVTADEQQWQFYKRRTEYRSLSKLEQQRNAERYGDEARGFYTGGLFQYSRHPNFFAEQALWLVYYLFSVSALTGGHITQYTDLFNWSLIGAVLLSLSIFQGSTSLTENISQQKYPEYALYRQSTSRLIPWFLGNNEWKKHKKQ